MIITEIILTAVFGALWRRHLGGWLAVNWHPRMVAYAIGAPLTWPIWYTVHPWWVAFILSVGVFSIFAVGAIINRLRNWFGHHVSVAPVNGFIDGYGAIVELALGGVVWGSVAALCLAVR